MAIGFQNQANTRVMFTSATAETAYPTGVTLGLKGQADAAAGDVNGAADTRTTTQANSVFSQTSTATNPVAPMRHAILRSIEVLTAGAAASTITLQDQAGQKALTPALDGATAGRRVEFGAGGIPVNGGFRVVTASGGAAPICAITYDLAPY